MRKQPLYLTLVIALLFVPLTLTGCDSFSGESATEGSIEVLLTDAPFPFDLVAEANVTIERVELVTDAENDGEDAFDEDAEQDESDELIVLSNESQPFNLLELRNGVTATLVDEPIPAGNYNQIRLIVSEESSVVLNDGTTFDLKVPSGTETGLKVLVPDFEIDDESDVVVITVDFDVSDSFVVRGNPDTPAGINGFIFKPVIKPAAIEVNGEQTSLIEGGN